MFTRICTNYLDRLYDKGRLTDEEFVKLKRRVLGELEVSMKHSTRREIKKRHARENILTRRQSYLARRRKGHIAHPSERFAIRRGTTRLHNRTLNYLVSKKFIGSSNRRVSGRYTVKIPETFSITENYDETMKILRLFVDISLSRDIDVVEIDHTSCKQLGLSASSIMDELASLSLGYKNYIKSSFKYSGIAPKSGHVTDMIIVSGLIKRLNAQHDAQPTAKIIPLELMKNQDPAVMQTRFIDFINSCLGSRGYNLTRNGIKDISTMIGEILDNCTLHCGDSVKNYNLIGHFRDLPDCDCGECSVSIFNFGKTIYETFAELDPECEVVRQLKAITSKHINFFNRYWTEETLWTLYALQELVSSKNAPGEHGHGSGTITFLDIFTKLKASQAESLPRMCITSGRSQIVLDGTYKIEYNQGRKIIAFNGDNDLSQPPDKKYVYSNDEYFPGTIISIKFYVDKQYLESIIHRDKGEDDEN